MVLTGIGRLGLGRAGGVRKVVLLYTRCMLVPQGEVVMGHCFIPTNTRARRVWQSDAPWQRKGDRPSPTRQLADQDYALTRTLSSKLLVSERQNQTRSQDECQSGGMPGNNFTRNVLLGLRTTGGVAARDHG